MKCVEMTLGEPDESGRCRPIVKEGSEFILDVDTVIMSIGHPRIPLSAQRRDNLECAKWGGIIADETTMATSRPGVYAGGMR
jgi:glutamate synthase (NADPH/NADH) small chain